MPMCLAVEEVFELNGIDKISVMGEGDAVSWLFAEH